MLEIFAIIMSYALLGLPYNLKALYSSDIHYIRKLATPLPSFFFIQNQATQNVFCFMPVICMYYAY